MTSCVALLSAARGWELREQSARTAAATPKGVAAAPSEPSAGAGGAAVGFVVGATGAAVGAGEGASSA